MGGGRGVPPPGPGGQHGQQVEHGEQGVGGGEE